MIMAKKIDLFRKRGSKHLDKTSIIRNSENIKLLLKKHIPTLSIIIFIIIALPVYFFLIKPRKEHYDEKISGKMYKAVYFFENNEYDKALNGWRRHKGFKNILNTYKKTKIGQLASFYIGIICMHNKQYNQAIEHFKKFKIKDIILMPKALSLTGDAYSQQGNFKEALANYLKAAEYASSEIFTPKYLLKAANVSIKLENNKEAAKCYEKILKSYKKSKEANIAKKKLYALTYNYSKAILKT